MKTTSILRLLLLSASATAVLAADAPPLSGAEKPELRGMLATATEKRFNLAVPGAARSEWATIGDSFGEWRLAEFQDASGTLVLRKDDGAELDLSLVSSHVTPGEDKATVADAGAVLEKMRFTKILAAALDPQKKAMLAMANKIAAKTGLAATSGPAYADYQKKAADLVNAALDPKTMAGDMAQIYSSVYTKDELSGLGDFFDSPVGQAYTAKAPQVQQQLQAVMMPRIMALVPQLQALAKPPAGK